VARARKISQAPAASLVMLGCAAFVYVTSETLPIGLLPQISDGLSVSDGQVGLLLTGYAAVAAVTAIPFTAWTTHARRDRLVYAVMALFVLSQLGSALAPTYAWLVAARVVCALGHGVFWAVIAPIAARLVPAGQAGRATATVFVGNSLAIVAGVPLGTLLGQAAGWRVAYAVVGVIGAVVLVVLRQVLPPLPGAESAGFSAALFRRLATPRLLSLYAVTVLMVIGHFAAYTYLAPLAVAHGGISGSGYGVLLLGYGGAGLAATIGLGRIVDRRPRLSFALPMATLAIATAVLGHSGATWLTIVAVLAWGGAFVCLPVMLQAAVLRVAADPDVASAVYVVAFQIGIGGGAALGAGLVDAGHLDVTTVVASLGTFVALVVGVACRGLFPRSALAVPSEPHVEVAQHE
jgi:predicted MFS family arabinose efflux permease